MKRFLLWIANKIFKHYLYCDNVVKLDLKSIVYLGNCFGNETMIITSMHLEQNAFSKNKATLELESVPLDKPKKEVI